MWRELKQKISKAKGFLAVDLWIMDLKTVPRIQRVGYRLLRIVQIVGRDFIRDKCPLQASALTYITLMSLVPFLAMGFSVAKGMGAQEWLMNAMDATLSTLPHQISDFIRNIFLLVERTDFLTLGAIGTVLLVFTVIKVMGQIEKSFNHIWGIHQHRTFVRKFSDYLSVVMVVPIIIVVAFTLNATLSSSKVTSWMDAQFGPLANLYEMTLRLSGTVGVILAFSLLYIFLPNTKVKWSAAITGGIVAGLAWILWQWICIRFQIVITRFNTIYGAFATLPISLFWLHVNWMITLFGAELCFASQNHRTYLMETNASSMSFASRRWLAFLLVYDICRVYRKGEQWSAQSYQEEWNVPIRLIQDVLHALEDQGVVIETADAGYVPGRDMQNLTLDTVEQALIGEPDARTNQLSRRLSRRVLDLIGDKYAHHHEELSQITFDDVVRQHEDTEAEAD